MISKARIVDIYKELLYSGGIIDLALFATNNLTLTNMLAIST